MKRNYVLFAIFLSAQIAVVADAYAQAIVSADPPPPRLAKSASLDSINPLTNDQFTRLCANSADPADCGKRIEAQQLKQASAASIVRRDGKLLAITVPGEPPFIFEDIDSEAGPNISFYSYSSPR